MPLLAPAILKKQQNTQPVSNRALSKIEESKKIRNNIHFNEGPDELLFKEAPLGHIKPVKLDLARIVVHKKGLEIDGVNYICEISYNKKGFYITLFSIYHT